MVKTLLEQYNVFLTKIIFPAFLIIGFKIAIEMKIKKTKVSWLNVILSFLIGVVGAYISGDLILESISPKWVTPIVAIVAILSEKIGEFLIFKLNVDVFLTAIIDVVLASIIRKKE